MQVTEEQEAGTSPDQAVDVFVIGGGVNGVAIARDSVGRGLSVILAEKSDLSGETSSKSTKMFHGGLRYLEYFEFKLVRSALQEREVLLKNMPHISWPMRFVLPLYPSMRFEGKTPTSNLLGVVMPWMKGRRPAWLIRFGLFLYDSLGGRKILPATSALNLRSAPEGKILKKHLKKAYEYSDCWVDDSRLVSLMAQDAGERGAQILTRLKITSAKRNEGLWEIQGANGQRYYARALVNAAGPWVEDVVGQVAGITSKAKVNLVRGSHILTKRFYDHEKAYFFQGEDGRIIFIIPCEDEFTLIGTTDVSHESVEQPPYCTEEEIEYLCHFASTYFVKPITKEDVVSSFSGVRPLFDDGEESATAATREYVLTLNEEGAPLLSVFGGKITTHRKLAEEALGKLSPFFSEMGEPWTFSAPLPGGDFKVEDKVVLAERLQREYSFLDEKVVSRLIRSYGTSAFEILGQAKSMEDLGEHFGHGLTSCEVEYLINHEFVVTAEDILWRRSKLGLRFNESQVGTLNAYLEQRKV